MRFNEFEEGWVQVMVAAVNGAYRVEWLAARDRIGDNIIGSGNKVDSDNCVGVQLELKKESCELTEFGIN